MPRVCTVCTHPRREAVEQGLLSGKTITALAAESGLASTSIRRHHDRHLALSPERGREQNIEYALSCGHGYSEGCGMIVQPGTPGDRSRLS